MKKYVAYSTIIRTLLALHEGARLLIWSNKYFLLSAPPARLTTKMISALGNKGWIKEPQIISDDLAEYTLSQEGTAFAKYLSQRQGKTDLSPVESFLSRKRVQKSPAAQNRREQEEEPARRLAELCKSIAPRLVAEEWGEPVPPLPGTGKPLDGDWQR